MLAVATAIALLASTASASAATYRVEVGGADVGDCTGTPCETIDYALTQHRLSPQPDDVIEVGSGDYAQNVDATDPADDGLTIRGELDGGGVPATTITGDGGGSLGCLDCIVSLGTSPDTNVTLENADVAQDTADLDLSPIHLDGGSDLDTVGAFVDDANTFAAVELCTDPGTVIENSFLDATGTDARGIDGCAAIEVIDTGVFTDDQPAVDVFPVLGGTTEITRSWLSASEVSPQDTLVIDGDLTVDSSLVTGGDFAINHAGSLESDIVVSNSTVDAAEAGLDDGTALFLGRAGSDPIDALADSSILVDQLRVDFPGAPLTLTCVYTNFTDKSTPVDTTDFTDDCPDGTEPGSTNTFADPDDLFVGFGFGGYDWRLRSGSPGIDAGQPGAVPPGLSDTDFLGDPRRVPGTTATCPDGVRDQGAFERRAVSCQHTLTVSTTGTGSGTVSGPGIDCGGSGSDCAETVPVGTQIQLTAAPAGGSSFDGFTGGGCSASPCTVTLDANRSVQARFTNVDPGARTLVVETSGTGTGTITGPGIDCGGGDDHTDCRQSYALGEQVELRAEAGADSIFDRFTGSGCEADPCTVTMDATRAVVGRFMNARTPRTSFARRPHGRTRNPVFRMRSSQPVPTFECRLDDGEWEECERRVRLRGLDAGRHVFRARATNKLGVTGPPARAKFRVRRR